MGTVNLPEGVHLSGGWGEGWRSATGETVLHAKHPEEDRLVALRVQGAQRPTCVTRLTLTTADAPSGVSTYGVLAQEASGLILQGVISRPGAGGLGAEGALGEAGEGGEDGGDAYVDSLDFCPADVVWAGGGGRNPSCPEANGRGGIAHDGQRGEVEVMGERLPAASAGEAGEDGHGGQLGPDGWRGRAGEPGQSGAHGRGALGGVALHPGDWLGPTESAYGGGGGAGGCGGQGGGPGAAGGGAFALYAVASPGLQVHRSTLGPGPGGVGGAGGSGGPGGDGGLGGGGLSCEHIPPDPDPEFPSDCDAGHYRCDPSALHADDGQDGGDGGRGGRGADGPSVAIACVGGDVLFDAHTAHLGDTVGCAPPARDR